MVKKNSTIHDVLSHRKEVSLIFLGIGLVMFLMNISGLLAYLPESYSYSAFNISVFSSMLIIIYSTYVLNSEKVQK